MAEATAKEGIDHRAPGDTPSTLTTDQTNVAARDIFKGRPVMHNKMAHQTVDWKSIRTRDSGGGFGAVD